MGLYHPVFDEFQDAMKTTEPLHADAETYIAVRNFLAAFSQIYQDERERVEAIKETMRPLLDRELLVVVDDNDKSDGVIMQPFGRSTAYLLMLGVNAGPDHTTLYNRGSLAYWKYWIDSKLN